METRELGELEQRLDGVTRVLMSLIADLEMREQLDGARFCATLRRTAKGRKKALPSSARTIELIAGQLDEARANRRKQGRRT